MKKIMKNGKINGILDVYGIIYLVKNKVNGKCYIGQTYQKNGFRDRYGVGNGRTNIESFYKAHKNSNSGSDIILEDMDKYGLDVFEINECIDYAFSKEELDIKERVYISFYKSMINNNNNNSNNSNNNFTDKITNGIFIVNSNNNCYIGGYNKTSGGSGAKDYKWSEESKQKLKETKNTPEALERAREAARKENLSLETLKQRSESLKGHNISDNTKSLISNSIEKMWEDGKYSSKEVKKNMIEGQKRRWENEDNRKKTGEITKKNWENNDYREKVLGGIKKYWDDEDKRKEHSKKQKEIWNNEELRKKQSEISKKNWENDDYREKVANGTKEYWNNEDNRKKRGKKMKEIWDKDKKEEWSKAQKEIQNRLNVKEKKSNTMIKKWQNEEYKSGVSSTLSKKWENEEYRNNVLNGMKKAWKNKDLRKQKSEVTKGGNNPRAKAVVCITSIEKNYDRKIFSFLGEASNWIVEKCGHYKKANEIARCCDSEREYYGIMPDGTLLKWKYLKDFNKDQISELFTSVKLTNEEKIILFNQFGTF